MKLLSGIKKKSGYDFRQLFSPLDLVTISYVLITGVYLAFGAMHLSNPWPHFGVRGAVLLLILVLAIWSRRFPNKMVLFLRNLYPLIFLGFFYTETSDMKHFVFDTNLDDYFLRAEMFLWGTQPGIVFSKVMCMTWFSELMNAFYFSYYLITTVICIALYIKHPPTSYKGIFTVVFSFYLYYIIYAIFPVVGPQYHVPEACVESQNPLFFGKIMGHILSNLEKPTGAFPSSHVGIAVILCMVAYGPLKKLFYSSLPFVLGICFATVYLHAHYLVDVLAGIVTAPIFFVFSSFVYERLFAMQNNKKGPLFPPGLKADYPKLN
jgi:membrane-associated phospholipid phosphatase